MKFMAPLELIQKRQKVLAIALIHAALHEGHLPPALITNIRAGSHDWAASPKIRSRPVANLSLGF